MLVSAQQSSITEVSHIQYWMKLLLHPDSPDCLYSSACSRRARHQCCIQCTREDLCLKEFWGANLHHTGKESPSGLSRVCPPQSESWRLSTWPRTQSLWKAEVPGSGSLHVSFGPGIAGATAVSELNMDWQDLGKSWEELFHLDNLPRPCSIYRPNWKKEISLVLRPSVLRSSSHISQL